jgi:hypothetical protein
MKVKKLIKMVDGWTGALKVNVQTFCDEGAVYLDAEKKSVLEYLRGLDPKEDSPWIVQGFEGGALFLSVTQLPDHSVLPAAHDTDRHYATKEERDQAREAHCLGSDDEIEIDPDAKVSRTEDGTWVSAWVWVATDRFLDFRRSTRLYTERTHNYLSRKCRACGEPLPEAGDGWDGECGNCADRRVNNG